jgi:hypothetical protein
MRKNRQYENVPGIVPVRLDRHTVVYAKREKVEACGGVEGYLKWFNGKRTGSKGEISVLSDLS